VTTISPLRKTVAALALGTALAACAHAPAAPAASPSPSAGADTPTTAWDDARQLVLVTTPNADATQGQLRTNERDGSRWRAVADATPVTVGRSGIAWGLGLHPPQPGLQKREGDGRAPAGAFRIGTAFGYAPTARTALPYLAATATHWCVDVSGSPLYNRIVDSTVVGEAAVKDSTEPMRRDLHANGDQRYRLGFVIEHNPDGVAGAGSCIFAHLWKAPGESTAGCTAMASPAMDRLAGWLRPEAHPVFVQLTDADAERLRGAWHLPARTD
jgi:L,D-peptidoglycan transpeptidase YkuD (ErfK/YbiS/YcfS/YnhG family)